VGACCDHMLHICTRCTCDARVCFSCALSHLTPPRSAHCSVGGHAVPTLPEPTFPASSRSVYRQGVGVPLQG
jgi:hypothetical protein